MLNCLKPLSSYFQDAWAHHIQRLAGDHTRLYLFFATEIFASEINPIMRGAIAITPLVLRVWHGSHTPPEQGEERHRHWASLRGKGAGECGKQAFCIKPHLVNFFAPKWPFQH
jgi:hypothetical protein